MYPREIIKMQQTETHILIRRHTRWRFVIFRFWRYLYLITCCEKKTPYKKIVLFYHMNMKYI